MNDLEAQIRKDRAEVETDLTRITGRVNLDYPQIRETVKDLLRWESHLKRYHEGRSLKLNQHYNSKDNVYEYSLNEDREFNVLERHNGFFGSVRKAVDRFQHGLNEMLNPDTLCKVSVRLKDSKLLIDVVYQNIKVNDYLHLSGTFSGLRSVLQSKGYDFRMYEYGHKPEE